MLIKCSVNRRNRWYSELLSVSVSSYLVCVLVLMPLSTRALGAQNAIMGSVSAVGAVQLRGVPISSEGTLFDGDRIQTAGDAYVKVQLTEGPQLELGADTDVQVDRGNSLVQIAMNRGSMAFSSPGSSVPVTVSVASLRIEALPGAAAEVAFLAPNSLSVKVLTESVMVAGLGQDPAPVGQDEQVIIDLDAVVESTEPSTPGTETDDGSSEGSSAKWVVIGASAGGAAGIGVFLAKKDKGSASQSQP